MVGGVITIESDAKSEYHECLVKAKSILDILNDENKFFSELFSLVTNKNFKFLLAIWRC